MKILEDAIAAVAFAFERANGNILGEYEQSEIRHFGLDECEPNDLATGLRAGILDGDAAYRSQSYWALGKRFDREAIPYFRERLAAELTEEPSIVFQLLIALDNLDEPVFSDARNGSFSSLDDDMNLQDAEAYLRALREQKEAQQAAASDGDKPPN